jgi:hypothetical protein
MAHFAAAEPSIADARRNPFRAACPVQKAADSKGLGINLNTLCRAHSPRGEGTASGRFGDPLHKKVML